MNWNESELSYRKAAVQGASPIGLVILLYDALVRDLRKAITEMHARNVEGYCQALKHGFLVLAQMEGMLDMVNGGDTAKNLARFYSLARSEFLRAQVKRSPELLERQITQFVDMRQAWQQSENKIRESTASESASAAQLYVPREDDSEQPNTFDCSV